MEASGSKRKTQRQQGAVKRKMDCCKQNATRQKKNKHKATIPCDYCQCVFDNQDQLDFHRLVHHQCMHCLDIVLDVDVRIHNIRHQQEEQLESLQLQRQRKMHDDFVLCYVKANRLHEYRSQLDYDPDFDYIRLNYRLEKEEWLAFVKKFKHRFLDYFYGTWESHYEREYLDEQSNVEFFSYLLENGAMSIHEAIDFMDILMTKTRSYTSKYDDYASAIVSYLFGSGCKIKVEWVAKAIKDDKLMERIKEKHTFTFDEIHKARTWNLYSPFDINGMKPFYIQLQKHFSNPNFENSFDDFNGLRILPGQTCLRNRFIYDEKNDQLSIDLGEAYPLGSCAEMMAKSLTDLVKAYIRAMEMYIEQYEKDRKLFNERAYEAWKLYFVISMK